jgi:hypothetical protein
LDETTGEEIFDGKAIAIKYLKGRFFFDLLATLPLDFLIANAQTSATSDIMVIQILKITRLARFTKVIAFLNVVEEVKLSLKLSKLIFYLLCYLHLQACLWFYITKQDKTWFPILDHIINQYHFYEHGFGFTYCFSVYHSVSILDGGEMAPATAVQAIIVSALVIIAEFIHAHILGTISDIIQSLNRKSTQFQEQIEFATSAMRAMKLTDGIQKNIVEYITIKHAEMDA